jgi:acyl-CoA reductase-like NAD-dependent aldehyde dehydrogenase
VRDRHDERRAARARADGLGALARCASARAASVGHRMLEDARVPADLVHRLDAVGRKVAQTVAARFGRTILELGGNNASC